jgi:hypothetical protein
VPQIVGRITVQELAQSFGEGIGKSITTELSRSKGKLIPNFADLQLGDVVLSRESKPARWPFSLLPSVVGSQSKVSRFRGSDAPLWSHAMLYVGRMHVAESTNFFKVKNLQWHTGIRVAPLISPTATTEMLICRRRPPPDDEQLAPGEPSAAYLLETSLKEATLYALTDYAVARRSYGFDRAAAIGLSRRPILQTLFQRFFPDRFNEAIICSEYVLECLARGSLFSDEYASVGGATVFYPADFWVNPHLDKIDMTYLEID